MTHVKDTLVFTSNVEDVFQRQYAESQKLVRNQSYLREEYLRILFDNALKLVSSERSLSNDYQRKKEITFIDENILKHILISKYICLIFSQQNLKIHLHSYSPEASMSLKLNNRLMGVIGLVFIKENAFTEESQQEFHDSKRDYDG